jgi:hypothetical protein
LAAYIRREIQRAQFVQSRPFIVLICPKRHGLEHLTQFFGHEVKPPFFSILRVLL